VSPDGWVRWYYDTRDSFGAPALNYIDTVGRVYAKRCSAKKQNGAKCNARIRHCTSTHEWVCGKCGASWKYWMRALSKGEIQKSLRPFGFDQPLARYFDVARLLHDFLREGGWNAKLYVVNAMGEPAAELAQRFPERFPDAPGPWRKTDVLDRVRTARAEWIERLASAGIKVN